MQYYQQPRQLAIPLINFNDHILPIYASEWEEEYLVATPRLRVLGMLRRLFQADHNGLISLNAKQKSQTFLICYEDCINISSKASSKLDELFSKISSTKLIETFDPALLDDRIALTNKNLDEFYSFYTNLSKVEQVIFDELLEVYQLWQLQQL
jgi:hypothetical protein